MRRLRLTALVACAALLLGCVPTVEVVDGWPIGDCGPEGPYLRNGLNAARSSNDELLIQTAERRLYQRDPYHPEVVSKVLCTEVMGDGVPTREIGNKVALFMLAGGSRRAILVGSRTPNDETITVDYGP